MCVCGAGVCEYVVWDDDDFDEFFLFYGIGVFLSFWIFVQKVFWGKTRDSETLCSKHSFGSEWRPVIGWIIGRSVGQAVKGKKGKDECCYFFSSFSFLFVEETFLQRETQLTYSLQHIHLSHTAGPQLCKISKYSVVKSSFSFFSSFSLDLDGGKTVGRAGTEFVLFMFWDELFTRFSRQAWLGESWRKLSRRSHQIGL